MPDALHVVDRAHGGGALPVAEQSYLAERFAWAEDSRDVVAWSREIPCTTSTLPERTTYRPLPVRPSSMISSPAANCLWNVKASRPSIDA